MGMEVAHNGYEYKNKDHIHVPGCVDLLSTDVYNRVRSS